MTLLLCVVLLLKKMSVHTCPLLFAFQLSSKALAYFKRGATHHLKLKYSPLKHFKVTNRANSKPGSGSIRGISLLPKLN
jgi:hypothetical protein